MQQFNYLYSARTARAKRLTMQINKTLAAPEVSAARVQTTYMLFARHMKNEHKNNAAHNTKSHTAREKNHHLCDNETLRRRENRAVELRSIISLKWMLCVCIVAARGKCWLDWWLHARVWWPSELGVCARDRYINLGIKIKATFDGDYINAKRLV